MDWKLGGLIVVAMVAAGCDSRIARSEDGVRALLKDPSSAKFGKTKAYGPKENFVACGTVNAKNSFGGYVGDRPFMVRNTAIYIGDDETSGSIMACCSGIIAESKLGGSSELSSETSANCNGVGVMAGFLK